MAMPGIFMVGNGTSGNQVQGNYIGTDATGANARGNTFEGIYIQQARTNLIGGSTTGAGNVISANNTRGMWLTNSSWNTIQGNLLAPRRMERMDWEMCFMELKLMPMATNNILGGTIAGRRKSYRICTNSCLFRVVRVP